MTFARSVSLVVDMILSGQFRCSLFLPTVAVSLKVDGNVSVCQEVHHASVDEAQLCCIKRHMGGSAGGYRHPAEGSTAWNSLSAQSSCRIHRNARQASQECKASSTELGVLKVRGINTKHVNDYDLHA